MVIYSGGAGRMGWIGSLPCVLMRRCECGCGGGMGSIYDLGNDSMSSLRLDM